MAAKIDIGSIICGYKILMLFLNHTDQGLLLITPLKTATMRISSIAIICLFVALPSTLFSATSTTPANASIYPPEEILQKLTSLKTKEVQQLIGRKLTLKEKVSLLILKHTSKRKAQGSKGSTALGFGIAAIALILLGLFVPYIILLSIPAAILAIVFGNKAKKQDPSDKKAQAGVTLGWIAVGAIALIVVAAIIVASSGAWY